MDRIAAEILRMKSAELSKLEPFGFERADGAYRLVRPLCADMSAEIVIDDSGRLSSRVVDGATGDEYTLHLVPGSEGEFVGRVRSAYERLLGEIARDCFRPQAFADTCLLELVGYARGKYGGELEFLWKDTPDCAVLRRGDNKKWYAVFMRVARGRLQGCGGDPDEKAEVVNVRVDCDELPGLCDGYAVFPGYHMNKKHWATVLPSRMESGAMRSLIDASHALAAKKR